MAHNISTFNFFSKINELRKVKPVTLKKVKSKLFNEKMGELDNAYDK